MRNVFSAKAVGRGGVIQRSARDVERVVGRSAFLREVQRRGFTLVENGDQLVVFCNRDPVRLIVQRDPPSLSQRASPVGRGAHFRCWSEAQEHDNTISNAQ